MSRYMQEVRELIPVTVDVEDLVTLAQAARMLGVSIQSVAGSVSRGMYDTIVIDTEAPPRKGRRLLLRGEVMERVVARVAHAL